MFEMELKVLSSLMWHRGYCSLRAWSPRRALSTPGHKEQKELCSTCPVQQVN